MTQQPTTLEQARAIAAKPISDTDKAAQLGILWYEQVPCDPHDMAMVIEQVALRNVAGLLSCFELAAEDEA